MPVQVEGAAVLVTGASSGIGAALAPLLAQRGARVAVVARREDRLNEVVDRCRALGGEARLYAADLSDTDAAEALALQVDDDLGGLDVLVNNAGAPKRRRVTEVTLDEIRSTMRLNFESPVRMSLALLPRMLERDRCVIVNVSSFGGRVGIPEEAAYCASKFALCGWSESMALDLWHTGVDVRLVLPGAIDTEIWTLPDNNPPAYQGPLEPAETVASGIIDAIEGTGFEHYLPDMKAIAEFKTADIDTFMSGAVEFATQRE